VLGKSIVETTRRFARHTRPRANSAAYVGNKTDKEAATEWDKRATDRFLEYWWNRLDYFRRPGVTFGTLQDMFITTQFTQGDLAYIWTNDGLAVIEGMQIDTPRDLRGNDSIQNGFRINSKGRATHLYYHDFNSRGALDYSKPHRISMLSVIFCPWYWRAAQRRSVPRLHGIIDAIRDHEEIHADVKAKVKQESKIHTVEKSGVRKAPGSNLDNSDGTETNYEETDRGMRIKIKGRPSDDFIFAQGATPHAQYVPLMEYDSKLIAAGGGIPYKAVMALFDGSWSSNKSVQGALKMYIGEIWEHRNVTMVQRVWNRCIIQDIRAGYLPPAPVNAYGFSLFNKVSFSRPYFPQLDQDKEERGRSSAFRNMTQSVEDWADEQQTTSDELFERHKENMKRLVADAKEVGLPIEKYAPNLIAQSSSVSASSQQEQEL